MRPELLSSCKILYMKTYKDELEAKSINQDGALISYDEGNNAIGIEIIDLKSFIANLMR